MNDFETLNDLLFELARDDASRYHKGKAALVRIEAEVERLRAERDALAKILDDEGYPIAEEVAPIHTDP
jgi:hypothetical protein